VSDRRASYLYLRFSYSKFECLIPLQENSFMIMSRRWSIKAHAIMLYDLFVEYQQARTFSPKNCGKGVSLLSIHTS